MILGGFFQRVKTISPDEVRTFIKTKSTAEYCLLDVRQPAEYEQEHIPGAKLIPLNELPANLSRVNSGQRIIVYCRSGNRSRSGVGILNGAGFDDVYNMEGGMLAYNGLVAAGPPEAGVFCFPGNMAPEELTAMAWYIEDGSQKFFDTVSGMSADQEVKKTLASLVGYKNDHKEALTGLYQRISGKPAADEFPGGILNKPPGDVMAGCVSVPEAVRWARDRGISDILDLMMALEANTLDLYLKLGRQVASDQAKAAFSKLAGEEVQHLDRLAAVFEKTL